MASCSPMWADRRMELDPEKTEASINWVISRLPIIRTSLLSAEQAVEGTDFVPPMVMSTSAGWPYNITKGQWWEELGQREVAHTIEQLKVGGLRAEMPLYVKDELRPSRKRGVPRTFVCVPPSLIVVGRMLTAYYDQCISQVDNPIKVGLNPWEGGFCDLIRKFDPNKKFLCGDYKGYDSSIHPFMAYVLTKVRGEVMQLKGEEWNFLQEYYWTIFNSPVVDVYGGVHSRSGGMPSGMSSTATDNSIINMFLLHYVLGDDIEELVVYGDDHVVQLSGELKVDIVGEMRKLGFAYTDVRKHTDVRLVPLEDVEFLKFKPKRVGAHVVPMREDMERLKAILEYHRTRLPMEKLERAFAVLLLSYNADHAAEARTMVKDFVVYNCGYEVGMDVLADWEPTLQRLAIANKDHVCKRV